MVAGEGFGGGKCDGNGVLPLAVAKARLRADTGTIAPMMQSLRPETQSILADVERVTGRPVQFLRDDSLVPLSTMVTARHGAPYHILRHRPSNEPLDYFVAYQAGFVLRLYGNAPAERVDFAATSAGPALLKESMLAASVFIDRDDPALDHFVKTVHHWALMQLRSLPIGMRVDTWIAREYPGLKDLQTKGIGVLQQQNAAILSQRVGNLTVPPPLLGTCAAHAVFADRLTGGESFAVPYSAMGLIDGGRELLQLWDGMAHDPSQDRALVDAWGTRLGLQDWYRWIQFEP